MEYEKVYRFQASEERPAKRRRVEPQGLQTSWKRRRQAFDEAWRIQQEAIDLRLNGIHNVTTDKVWQYLNAAIRNQEPQGIPTGIILTGPDGATESGIIKHLVAKTGAKGSQYRRVFVSLPSSSGTNLKALLKTIIQKATAQREEPDDVDDEDDELRSSRTFKGQGLKLLNYDLQILANHVEAEKLVQVVLAIEDTEAFDGDLLSKLIELMACWQSTGRIPFACLLNVATSVDFLQQRLSRAAIRALDGKVFDVAPSGDEVEQVCEAILDSGAPLWVGPGLLGMALERQRDYIQSVDGFVATVKYAIMSAYYANALTVFLHAKPTSDGIEGVDTADEHAMDMNVSADHYEALRTCDSFRAFARRLLDEGDVTRLRGYLEDNGKLLALLQEQLTEGRRKLSAMNFTFLVIRLLQQKLPNTQVTSTSSLYIQATSGKFLSSPTLRTLLLTIRKVPSNIAIELVRELWNLKCRMRHRMFEDLEAQQHDRLKKHMDPRIMEDYDDLLAQLQSLHNSQKVPLRSEDDIVQNSTLRTTVVAQKVELSKQKATLSENDKEYTRLLGLLSNGLEELFSDTIVNPSDLLFNEIFVYDLKSPYREAFTPRPRHAIERALAAPHDYLDCECCAPEGGDEATLAATQPATAVLYQLYLESGSLINVSDLWQAFQAVLGDGKEEAETMALFQRGLAELRYLGMMKATRKRADHVAKTMWRGL